MLRKQGSSGIWFTAAVVLLHLLALLLAWHYKRIYMGDTYEYVYEAMNIKESFFFYSGSPSLPITEEYMTQRQPGYPLFLMLTFMFTQSSWPVLILQNLLSIFNILYLRQVLFRLCYRKQYDGILFLLVATYPAQFIFANTVAPDILLQTFTLLYFGNFIALIKERKGRHALLMSGALVMGLFVKPVLYLFCVPHLLMLLFFLYRNRRDMGELTLAAILPLCAVLLYNSWNYERTGKFHFSSNQAFNAIFYYAVFENSTHGADSSRAFLKTERAKIAAMPLFRDRYDYANALGTRLLKAEWVSYSTFHLKHSLRFLIEPGKGEIDLFTGRLTYGGLYRSSDAGFYATIKSKGLAGVWDYIGRNPSLLLVVPVFLFNLIRILGLVIFVRTKSIPFYGRLFTLFILCYFAVMTGPIANTRYFLPVSLMVAGAAALGFGARLYNRSEPQTG